MRYSTSVCLLVAGLLWMAPAVQAQQAVQIRGWIHNVDSHDGELTICDAPFHFVTVHQPNQASFLGNDLWEHQRVTVTGVMLPDGSLAASSIQVTAAPPNEEYGAPSQPLFDEGRVLSSTPGSLTLQSVNGGVHTLPLSPVAHFDGQPMNVNSVVDVYGALQANGQPMITRVEVMRP